MSIIFGTVIGFLIGAYMPLSVFPSAVQTISALLPAIHITTLLKGVLLTPTAESLMRAYGAEAAAAISSGYGLTMNFAGIEVPTWGMYTAVGGGSMLLFSGLNILLYSLKGKKERS